LQRFLRIGEKFRMKPPSHFRILLKLRGYSDEAAEEIWKWYDYSERKGVNF
jgi:hypothetical protein